MTREDRAFQVRWEEYKVIQDKIDRIGDFKFRLRGWMITLVVAAVGAARLPVVQPEMLLLGFVVILVFYRLEAVQLRWERALGNRARALETELRGSYGAPGIVDALAFARNLARRRRIVGALLLGDDWVFYGLMCVIVAVGLWLSWDAYRAVEAIRSVIATIIAWIRSIRSH